MMSIMSGRLLLPIYLCKTGNSHVRPDWLPQITIHFKNWDLNIFQTSIAVSWNDVHYNTRNKHH
jgi:hypothetical protein